MMGDDESGGEGSICTFISARVWIFGAPATSDSDKHGDYEGWAARGRHVESAPSISITVRGPRGFLTSWIERKRRTEEHPDLIKDR